MDSENAPTPSFTLFRVLDETAQALGFESTHNPPALCQAMSRAEDIANEVGVPTRASVAHPNSRADLSLIIDCYAILIAQLVDPTSGSDPQAQMAAQQRRAAIALTWLSPSERGDLNLFLVAPPGAVGSTHWPDFAAQVERNEQVCRKLVWLPPSDSADWESSAIGFCNRTFLARPWLQQFRLAAEPRLDPLGHLAQGDPLMAKWLSLMEQMGEEDVELIDALVEAWKANEVEPFYVSS